MFANHKSTVRVRAVTLVMILTLCLTTMSPVVSPRFQRGQ